MELPTMETRLGAIETRFADIIWAHAPIKATELTKLAEAELGWKRTTTYTVLKRLCERGIFRLCEGICDIVISKEDFFSLQYTDHQSKRRILQEVSCFLFCVKSL